MLVSKIDIYLPCYLASKQWHVWDFVVLSTYLFDALKTIFNNLFFWGGRGSKRTIIY